ncbi:hypothetical protein BC829DRAFT_428926 [Chytridium lagenaria]|nr:hypothetical protein BC829DRAFT_428926 [Chytridium lagenaria]
MLSAIVLASLLSAGITHAVPLERAGGHANPFLDSVSKLELEKCGVPKYVTNGDSWETLAASLSVNVDSLKQWNPYRTEVTIGQIICGASPKISCSTRFSVETATTCTDLAALLQITTNVINELNPGLLCGAIVPASRAKNVGVNSVDKFQIGQALSLGASTGSPSGPANPTGCPNSHIIESDDTCYKIALKNVMALADLVALNPGVDCYKLQIGQALCLGASTGSPSGPANPTGCPNSHIIESGDTCYEIAHKNGMALTGLAPSTQPSGPANPTGCPNSHIIESGDTCYKIALKNVMAVADLVALNPGVDCNKLQIGQALCLGASTGSPSGPANPTGCPKSHIIEYGDTCHEIARENGMALTGLVALNPALCLGASTGSPSTSLPAPAPAPAPAPIGCARSHTIHSGDTCWAISLKNNLDVDGLIAINDNLDCGNLQIGAVICVCPEGRQSAPAPDVLWFIVPKGMDKTFGECTRERVQVFLTMLMARAVDDWTRDEDNKGLYATNHWTQMVWRSTTNVGCAKAFSGGNKCLAIVCHYSPPATTLVNPRSKFVIAGYVSF